MPLPATTQLPVDVLARHDPLQDRWRPPHDRSDVWVRLLVVLAVVTLVSAVALLLVQDDGRAGAVDASGSLVLEHHFSEWAAGPRDASTADGELFSGPIRIDLPDRQLVGLAQITLDSAAAMADGRHWLVHQWGQVRATLGPATCRGPFAWTSSRRPRATGGPFTLQCDDDSVLAATALVDGDEDAGRHAYRMFLRLTDGWYVAG